MSKHQQQPDPNVIPQFQARSFSFELAEAEFAPLSAIEWLNDQILAGWQLFEFNKMIEGDRLVILIVMARPQLRKINPAFAAPAGAIPTAYEPRQ